MTGHKMFLTSEQKSDESRHEISEWINDCANKINRRQSLPEYTRSQVQSMAHKNWLIVDGLILDISEFLRIHPGGNEVLLEFIGLDATSTFEDVGHSSFARHLLQQYAVGKLKDSSVNVFCNQCNNTHLSTESLNPTSSGLIAICPVERSMSNN